jgi:hypothetical protein
LYYESFNDVPWCAIQCTPPTYAAVKQKSTAIPVLGLYGWLCVGGINLFPYILYDTGFFLKVTHVLRSNF